ELVVKKGRCGVRNLDVGKDQRVNADGSQVGKRLTKLFRCTQSRIGLILRISAIDSANVPAIDLERSYAVLFCVGGEPGQVSKTMDDRILGVRQNRGLPGVFLTQPRSRARDLEVLVVPTAID